MDTSPLGSAPNLLKIFLYQPPPLPRPPLVPTSTHFLFIGEWRISKILSEHLSDLLLQVGMPRHFGYLSWKIIHTLCGCSTITIGIISFVKECLGCKHIQNGTLDLLNPLGTLFSMTKICAHFVLLNNEPAVSAGTPFRISRPRDWLLRCDPPSSTWQRDENIGCCPEDIWTENSTLLYQSALGLLAVLPNIRRISPDTHLGNRAIAVLRSLDTVVTPTA